MKINIWNRDRRGGHQVSFVFDRDGIAGSTPASRKAVKQFTGRKLRREANEAARKAAINYQEDIDSTNFYSSYYDEEQEQFLNFLDGEPEPNFNPDFDHYDPFDYRNSGYDDYVDSMHWGNNRTTEVIDLRTGNQVAVFSNYGDAVDYVENDKIRPLQISRICGYNSTFSCFD